MEFVIVSLHGTKNSLIEGLHPAEIGCSSCCGSASLQDVLEIVATASASHAGSSSPKICSAVILPVTLEHVFCIVLTPREGPEKWRWDLTICVLDYCG